MDADGQPRTILIDQSLLDRIGREYENILANDDRKKAYELARSLEGVFFRHRGFLSQYDEIEIFYLKTIIRLKYIALPILREDEVIELAGKFFTWQFRIPAYDLLGKTKSKLINIVVEEEKREFKKELTRALYDNTEVICAKGKLKTVKDWIADYNTFIGTETETSLKKTQYLTDLDKNKEITKGERDKIKTLINFYEWTRLDPLSPQGFEENMMIQLDKGLFVFRQGVLEPISDSAKRARTVSGPPKTVEEKKIDELKAAEERLRADSLERKVIDEAGIAAQRKIEDLKILARKYRAGSLERKAAEEEIRRLERSENKIVTSD